MRRPLRHRLSAVRASALTTLGARPRGFFVQYDYAADLPEAIDTYEAVEAHLAANGSTVDDFIDDMARHVDRFGTFGAGENDPEWGHGMFPSLDGAAAYTAVRKFEPSHIIEVGSGDSTRYLSRAARDCESPGKITCIDPVPRRSIAELDVQFIERVLVNEDVDRIAALETGDILFIDSSHIMLPGMDVDILFNRIFPRLQPGVVVHIHDIFLPDDYPDYWRPRFYSEQNALVGWILSGYFDVVYPGYFAITRHAARIEEKLGGFGPFAHGRSGSIWLQRHGSS